MNYRPGIAQLAQELASGQTTSAGLIEQALTLAQDPNDQGARVFIRVYDDAAREAARSSDRLRQHGILPSPLAGIPISVKDLFDISGETTLAGSAVLMDAPPAERDAIAIGRLRAAGAVIIGRTNMTEFAYSGLGLNPHYGTPGNPVDPTLIPGGSSSGAGVSVANGMAVVGIGTDTSGSVRIPAALCGTVGFKPTASRISREGVLPLSPTLDSVGPLGPDVASCAIVDAIMAGEPPEAPDLIPLDGLRLAIPLRYVLDDLDAPVIAGFQYALQRLKAAGARLSEIPFFELEELPSIFAIGTFAAAEGYAWHRRLLRSCEDLYDPRVAVRLRAGAELSAGDYLDLSAARRDLMRRALRVTRGFDALIMPTVPQVAPALADLETDDAAYWAANSLFLRNPGVANFLDRCALTIPCHEPGTLPVGLTIMGEHGSDRRMLGIGLAIEQALGYRTAAPSVGSAEF
jgi:aspartyl-tRNA(Asn)/glutamyl-tRNA(Gln) amidotransferase subunit A